MHRYSWRQSWTFLGCCRVNERLQIWMHEIKDHELSTLCFWTQLLKAVDIFMWNDIQKITCNVVLWSLDCIYYVPFCFRTALILCGIDSARCGKQSSEILVHIDTIASCSFCIFVNCTSMSSESLHHIPKVLYWIESWWLWRSLEYSELIVMFKKPVWDDLVLVDRSGLTCIRDTFLHSSVVTSSCIELSCTVSFLSAQTSLAILFWLLASTWHFHPQNWIFSLFWTILCKL